jgi:hypothetical protein
VQVPRTVNLWPPVTVDQAIGDVEECGVLDHRGGMQYTPQRQTGARRHFDQPVRGGAFGDVATLHHDVGTAGADQLYGLAHLVTRLRARGQYDPAAASRGQLLGQEQTQPAQSAGDEVGAVRPENPDQARWYSHAGRLGPGHVEHELAGVLSPAHRANGVGRLGKRIVGALR